MKVLWIGDAVVNSGFSVVTHNVCNRLYKLCDLEVYGIRYNGKAKLPYPYVVHPAMVGTDIYGFENIKAVVEETSPDVVVIFNDDHIIEKYTARIAGGTHRIVPMFPINLLPLDKERMLGFSVDSYNIPLVLTYTDFAQLEINRINPNIEVKSVYHGVEHTVFYPQSDVKTSLGLRNTFVVGTIGSNTYRKRLDLFLRGFAKFASNKSDVKCLIHATNLDLAYDLPTIVKDLRIEDKTILSTKSKDFGDVNIMYNLMDVNVNTSLGEGFGLPLIEGAACGVPVLCPEHGNLIDIWDDNATYIKVKDYEYIAGTKFVGGVVDIDDLADKLTMLYEDRNLLSTMGEKALEHSKTDRFSWDTVTEKVHKALITANKGRISYIG